MYTGGTEGAISTFEKKKYNNNKKILYGLAETYHSDMMHTAPAPNSLPEASSSDTGHTEAS